MSETGYQMNRKLGVAGPGTNTCFVQAFDRITPEADASTETYREYGTTMTSWGEHFEDTSDQAFEVTAALYDGVAQDLGGYGLKDMVFEHAHTARKLGRVLEELFDSDFRPVIDLVNRNGEVHCVGVKRRDTGLYTLVGTGVLPIFRGQPLTSRQIASVHYAPGYEARPRWPFYSRNIQALPAPRIKIPGRALPIRTEKGWK